MTTPEYLTAREVSAMLRAGENRAYELARKREISTFRDGTRVLFLKQSVLDYIARNTSPAKRDFFSHRVEA